MIGSSAWLKLISGTVLGAAGTAVVTEVIAQTERIVLGIPQSWLLAAVVGALIGVLLLNPADAGKIALPMQGAMVSRWTTLVLRVVLFAVFVAAFSVLAGWIVVFFARLIPAIKDAGVAASGLSGFVIKPMLPHYLEALQKYTARRAGGPQ